MLISDENSFFNCKQNAKLTILRWLCLFIWAVIVQGFFPVLNPRNIPAKREFFGGYWNDEGKIFVQIIKVLGETSFSAVCCRDWNREDKNNRRKIIFSDIEWNNPNGLPTDFTFGLKACHLWITIAMTHSFMKLI